MLLCLLVFPSFAAAAASKGEGEFMMYALNADDGIFHYHVTLKRPQ